MKEVRLDGLFSGKEIFHRGKNLTVKGLSNDSRQVKEGDLFFAVKGSMADGHDFVFEALKKGAVGVVVSERKVAQQVKNTFPDRSVVLVRDSSKALGLTARKFYRFPDREVSVIGITGTNGKTTTAYLISQYLERAGFKTGVIGTLGYMLGDSVFGEGRTTPDALQWYRLLREMADRGAGFVVAEISSHALDQNRVYGTELAGAVFTNLSREHLDYHRNMEDYFSAKKKIGEMLKDKAPFSVNVDDEYGRRLYSSYRGRKNVAGYGRGELADLKILSWELSQSGSGFTFLLGGKEYRMETGLVGLFNIYNLAGAVLLLYGLGFETEFLVSEGKNLKPVRGRFEVVEGKGITGIVDYAHTPDALENVLKTLNGLKKNRIITVFGAGGDRDREKRPVMGKVAEKLSDIVVITSDNPRSENPASIIGDILSGVEDRDKVVVEVDREKAVRKAVSLAEEGDIILLAGKGHETYQIIGDRKIPFDDRAVLEKYLKGF
ncbi:MAG: UDP-N-acetylmuramoyl-L-alanyl-D-glutamate--2,6-diaminopimelate ligase [Aquificae bacterium]|nr:UDP-N-acetylmuramoyl-L-alanyl-D-glutamate--2,6-diaminopimelate ligase [Aquificota bacterium]